MYTNHFAHWYFSNPTSNVLLFIMLLHCSNYIFRPKTPNRKESTGSSPSRKASNTSVESITSPPQNDLMTRSLSRNSNDGGGLIGKFRRSFSSSSGTKSLGRSSGISFLKDAEHTKETEDTHFIRWIIANRYAKIRTYLKLPFSSELRLVEVVSKEARPQLELLFCGSKNRMRWRKVWQPAGTCGAGPPIFEAGPPIYPEKSLHQWPQPYAVELRLQVTAAITEDHRLPVMAALPEWATTCSNLWLDLRWFGLQGNPDNAIPLNFLQMLLCCNDFLFDF